MSKHKAEDPFIVQILLDVLLKDVKRVGYEIKQVYLDTQDRIVLVASWPDGSIREVILRSVAK